MSALIIRYTHAAHVVVDGLLGATLIVYPFVAAHGADWTGFGVPAQWVIAATGALLVVSQVLRRAAALLEAVDPAAPASIASGH